VSYLTGIDEIGFVTRLLLGDPPGPLSVEREAGCIYRFLTPPPGILESVTGVEEVRGWKDVLDCGVWVKPGDEIRAVRTGGDRAGYIVAGGPDRAGAVALADRAEAAIQFRSAAGEAADRRTATGML